MQHQVNEIIDIALRLEENGHQFHIRCAKKISNHEIKKVFLFLAAQELKHKKIFESMKTDSNKSSNVYSDKSAECIETNFRKRIFEKYRKIDDQLDQIATPVAAIVRALSVGKDIVLYFDDLKSTYSDDKNISRMFDVILDEERRFVQTLISLMKQYKK
jgi:rubrerythrin